MNSVPIAGRQLSPEWTLSSLAWKWPRSVSGTERAPGVAGEKKSSQ